MWSGEPAIERVGPRAKEAEPLPVGFFCVGLLLLSASPVYNRSWPRERSWGRNIRIRMEALVCMLSIAVLYSKEKQVKEWEHPTFRITRGSAFT